MNSDFLIPNVSKKPPAVSKPTWIWPKFHTGQESFKVTCFRKYTTHNSASFPLVEFANFATSLCLHQLNE